MKVYICEVYLKDSPMKDDLEGGERFCDYFQLEYSVGFCSYGEGCDFKKNYNLKEVEDGDGR